MQPNFNLKTIAEGCVNANSESENSFYLYFYAFCFSLCAPYCKTNDDIEEVVNDGFLKIFKNLQSFNAAYSDYEASLRGWIKRIMINTAIDHYEKNRRKYFFSGINESVSRFFAEEPTIIDKFSRNDILKLVDRLSSTYRTVFSLYAIHGFKHAEIAKELQISVNTSKSNLFKARVNIQKMMQL